ncbi:hypothetical protein [Desnuesiella massiliensis]|uniref:hypothetical protein n=1 Tax=Desnuesiella massiliensis TaxID=1650662 RepID=UPI0006E24742|nr:hypothetical protein [Desnuesiella massiliensis]
MSDEERKLYDILFPNDNNHYHVNYAYFSGGSMRALSILKSKIKKSYIEPIIVEDEVNEGSFFARVLQKDVDLFLAMVEPLKYNQLKIPNRYMSKIKVLFEDSN